LKLTASATALLVSISPNLKN